MDEKKEKTFTRKQVEEILKKQILECSYSIEGNLSEYTAKLRVKETKLVKF